MVTNISYIHLYMLLNSNNIVKIAQFINSKAYMSYATRSKLVMQY